MVEVQLLSECDGFVGKFTSNMDRVIYALAAARSNAQIPYISLDAPFCFGGVGSSPDSVRSRNDTTGMGEFPCGARRRVLAPVKRTDAPEMRHLGDQRCGPMILEGPVSASQIIEAVDTANDGGESCVPSVDLIVRPESQTLEDTEKMLDEFLRGRFAWSLKSITTTSEEIRFVLERARGLELAFLEAVSRVQYPADGCHRLLFKESDRFFGLQISILAANWMKVAPLGSIPFIARVPSDWSLVGESWGCRDHQLDCFFLPSSNCDAQIFESNESDQNEGCMNIKQGVWVENDKRSCKPAEAHADAEVEWEHAFTDLYAARAAGSSKRWARKFHGHWMKEALELRPKFLCQGMAQTDVQHIWGTALFAMTFLRFNARTRVEVRRRVKTWREEHPTWAQHAHCTAIHIRHGDKLTKAWTERKSIETRNRAFNRSLADYAQLALEAAANESSSAGVESPSDPAMFIMTDDKDIVDAFAATSARLGVEFFSVEPGRPLVSTSAVQADSVSEQNHEILCKQAAESNILAQKGSQPTLCSFDYLRDPTTGRAVGHEELLQWLVSFELMSECNGFVGGSFDSHFTRFMFAWVCSHRPHCPWVRLLFPGEHRAPLGAVSFCG